MTKTMDTVAATVAARSEKAIQVLETAVSMESPSHDKGLNDDMGRYFGELAEGLGMSVTYDPQDQFGDNVVAKLPGNQVNGRGGVMMVGHIDTVYPVGTIKERPFTIEGNIATGPGVFDMKAGIVIGLEAIAAAQELSGTWDLPITFIMNTDEEPGSPKSRDVILREAEGMDRAFVLEPGLPGPSITLRRKGVAIFNLVVTGRESHAGVEPDAGVPAILDLALRIPDIVGLANRSTGTTVTVGMISGGTAPYVVPGRASASIDIRVPDLSEQARVEARMAQIASTEYLPGARTELDGGFHRPSFVPSAEATAIAEELRVLAAELGQDLKFGSSGGASDANLLSAAGIHTICGMGAHGGGAHSVGEYIELDSLTWKTQVLASHLIALNSMQ